MDLRFFQYQKENKLDRSRVIYQCKNCGDKIQSQHRHDFVTCECYSNSIDNKGIFVDGGTEYIRLGGNLGNIIEIYPKGDN